MKSTFGLTTVFAMTLLMVLVAGATRSYTAEASHGIDLLAYSIKFETLYMTSPHTGRVLITGTVKNIGTEDFRSRPGQQSINLYKDARLLATKSFTNVPAGETITITHEVDADFSPEFPSNYKLAISYDPGITRDGNRSNDDDNLSNNTRDRVEDFQRLPESRYPRSVALTAQNGRYVTADYSLGHELLANRDWIKGWEIFTLIDLGDDKVALRAEYGEFVTADLSDNARDRGEYGKLVANRDWIKSWETFTLIDRGNGQVALRAANNRYVAAVGGGGREHIYATSTTIGSWETFNLLEIEFGSLAIDSGRLGNVGAESRGNPRLVVSGPHRRFMLVHLGEQRVALKALFNGKYVTADLSDAARDAGNFGGLVANRDRIKGWETFTLIDRGNDRIALRAANGQYVSAKVGVGAANELVANSNTIGRWEVFKFY